MTALLPGALAALADSSVTLELTDMDVAEHDYAAAVADADIVIAHSLTSEVPVGAEGLRRTVLLREPLDVALPEAHPLTARDALRPRDVVDESWIGVPDHFPFDTVLQRIGDATGSSITPRLRLRDNQLIGALVAAGEGVALLPRFTTRPGDGLALRPLSGVLAERWIVGLSRSDRAERAAVRLVTRCLVGAGEALTG